jgi:hypothetical protein
MKELYFFQVELEISNLPEGEPLSGRDPDHGGFARLRWSR